MHGYLNIELNIAEYILKSFQKRVAVTIEDNKLYSFIQFSGGRFGTHHPR